MERYTLVFSGSGGQGIITASVLLAEAAVIHENLNAVQTQSYGPEARGGAARSDVILSKSEIRFPKVIQPNVLICLTQKAYNKFHSTIRPGGLLLADSHLVTREPRVDARQIMLPMYETTKREVGNTVVFNVCMLGVLVRATGLVRLESVERILESRVPAKYLDLNRRALSVGFDMAEGITI